MTVYNCATWASLTNTYQNLASPGDTILCTSGVNRVAVPNSDDWADLTNNRGSAGFVWDPILANWINPIVIKPAPGYEGQVVFGCTRINGNAPLILDGINYHDENTSQFGPWDPTNRFNNPNPAVGGYDATHWDHSWSLIYSTMAQKLLGIRNGAFSGKLSSTDGRSVPRGINGGGIVIEDNTFMMVGESINIWGESKYRRNVSIKNWQQSHTWGDPIHAVFDDNQIIETLADGYGSHGDVLHITLSNTGLVTACSFDSFQRNSNWQRGGHATQGLWVQDGNGGKTTIDFNGGYIRHFASLGTAVWAMNLSCVKNVIIECNNLLTDMASIVPGETPGLQLWLCDNVTIRNNVWNAAPQINPNCTNINYDPTQNLVIDRTANGNTGQSVAFPNIAYGAAIQTLADYMAAITPANAIPPMLADGTTRGVLKRGTGGVGYALNDRLGIVGVAPPTLNASAVIPHITKNKLRRMVRRRF